jgi:membrane-associated phospholipid phosphatase
MLCLLALVASIWLFGAIAEDVAEGDPLTIVDVRFSAWLQAHSAASVTFLMQLLSALHSLWFVGIMTLALSAYWRIKGLRDWVLILLSAVFGGMLLNFLLKSVFLRARPQFDHPIVTLTTYSFPSGHTMMATVFYGALSWFVLSRSGNWPTRLFAISIPLIMIPLVGFSRIYLGAHYLSDVLGAMAEGLAWLAFCLICAEILKRRRQGKANRAGSR